MRELKINILDSFIKSAKIISDRLDQSSTVLTKVERDSLNLSRGLDKHPNKYKALDGAKLTDIQLKYLDSTRKHFVDLSQQHADMLCSPVVLSIIDDSFDLNALENTFDNKLQTLNPSVIAKLEVLLLNTLSDNNKSDKGLKKIEEYIEDGVGG